MASMDILTTIRNYIKPSNGNGIVKASSKFGRHNKRLGATVQGTLSNLVTSAVSSWLSEYEKKRTNERANWLFQNDAVSRGIIKSYPVEVVNIGLTPVPKPMLRILGKSYEWGSEAEEVIFDYFELWGLSPDNYSDVQERLNFYMLQSLAVFQWALNGLAIFQVAYNDDPSRPLMLSLLPICSSRVQTPSDLAYSSDLEVYDGFELDEVGKPIAIYIVKNGDLPPTSDNMDRIEIKNKETGFPNVLLISDVENIAEYKQDSILSSMIKTLVDSQTAFDATVIKFLVSNLWTVFIENQTSLPDFNQSDEWEDRAVQMEMGTILQGLPGEKASVMASEHPGPNYADMVKSIYERLGTATGKGFENLLHSYNASYSASRANIENAGMYNDEIRKMLNNKFNQPVMNILIYEMALHNLIPGLPFFEVQRLKNEGLLYALTKCNFLPPPERPIDKYKNSRADTEQLNNLTTSLADIYAKNNQNYKQKLREIALIEKEKKDLEDQYGISFNPGSEEPIEETATNGD